MTACAMYTTPLRAALHDDAAACRTAGTGFLVSLQSGGATRTARAERAGAAACAGVWAHIGLVPRQKLPFPAGFAETSVSCLSVRTPRAQRREPSLSPVSSTGGSFWLGF